MADVFASIDAAHLRISNAAQVYLLPSDVEALAGRVTASGSRFRLESGLAIFLELVGEGASTAWGNIQDHANSSGIPLAAGAADAALEGDLLVSCFGSGGGKGRVIGTAPRTILPAPAESTCVILLPTALTQHQGGVILQGLLGAVGEGGEEEPLVVTSLGLFDIDRHTAEDFLEVYKGVEPAFLDMSMEMCSGPMLVMELSGPDAVARVRAVAGPRDIDSAKRIRPSTLRAQYGVSAGAPGLHCTDLAEDGPLDAEFFFSLLASK